MGVLSHCIDLSEAKRGDHVYALRKVGIYQHHGIIITGNDAQDFDETIKDPEQIMVVAQNLNGLEIVTVNEFCTEYINDSQWKHNLRRAEYYENPVLFKVKRRGTCYVQPSLPAEVVVKNACVIYKEKKDQWQPYSLLKRNCEHFAFTCSTGLDIASEQILAKYDLFTDGMCSTAMTIVTCVWGYCKNLLKQVIQIGEKIVPSTASNVTITSLDELWKNTFKGNVITASIALVVEIGILTIRWIMYLCVRENENKCKEYLAAGYAITTETYWKCLISAGIANLSSFVLSMVGVAVGGVIPLPGAVVGFSIFFGFIGYIVGRSGSDALLLWLQRLTKNKDDNETEE